MGKIINGLIVDLPSLDIHGPKKGVPSVDIHGLTTDNKIDIKKHKIDIPEIWLDIHLLKIGDEIRLPDVDILRPWYPITWY